MTEKTKLPLYFRILKFGLKTIMVLGFVLYLALGTAGAVSWFNVVSVRSIPIEDIYDKVDEQRSMGETQNAMFILNARPRSENAVLIDMIEPHVSTWEPVFMMDLSRRYVHEDQMDKALFWGMAGRFRMRYDALRCGHPEGFKKVDAMADLAEPAAVRLYLEQNPDQLRPVLQKVLNWDVKYPDIAHPNYLCQLLDKLTQERGDTGALDEFYWTDIRKTLHVTTQHFIDTPDMGNADLNIATPPVSE